MHPIIDKLLTAFLSKGWVSKGAIDISSDWWFTYIIELHSTWRSVNTPIFLTLLTDPQVRKEKQVWCIGVSINIPNHRLDNFITKITIKDINRTDLVAFVNNINQLHFS